MPEEIQEKMEAISEKAYRGNQIFKWLYRGIDKFDMMTDLPEHLRSRLNEELRIIF
jgi:23S rRNA (adenine2503-C2)-methyltransferase